MIHQSSERQQPHKDRIPVQNTRLFSQLKISPQWLEEIPGPIQRNATHHIAERGAEKYAKQEAGSAKKKIPKWIPDYAVNVVAEFDGRATQNQKPQHNHQWQIES